MEKVFSIVPASAGPSIFIWVLGVILLAVIALFIYIGYSSRNMQFTIYDDGLRISPGLYGWFIPREAIRAESVRVINLTIDSEYSPKWRTNGAGLPGYSAGWFKLNNGEKSLVFLTERNRVVYVPTTGNYSVLLSVREAEEFAGALQQWK
jgi:hypothetical protein